MKKILLLLGCGALLPVMACTTFATFNTESGNLMMAKNRDNRPDHQIVEVVNASGRYKYLALSRLDVKDFVSAGINEKNLAVFNEVTIEYSAQAVGGIADDFSKDILQNYAHATDVIKDLPKLIAKFPDPVFYQVADGQNILSIEVAPNHKFKYTLQSRGVFAHTNHYQNSDLVANYPYGASDVISKQGSEMRLQRVSYLLEHESSVDLSQLQQIGLDHSAGANNSIFRIGKEAKPNSIRSLAFFAVSIPHSSEFGVAQVVVDLYNVGEKYQYNLDRDFWAQYTANYTQLKPVAK